MSLEECLKDWKPSIVTMGQFAWESEKEFCLPEEKFAKVVEKYNTDEAAKMLNKLLRELQDMKLEGSIDPEILTRIITKHKEEKENDKD